MGDKTEISWSDATWNVVTGCTKVSEGCTHCYIDRTPPFRMQHRGFDGDGGIGSTTGVVIYPDRLELPIRWRKPRRIFVNSLSDLFHDDVPIDVIARVWAVMALAPQHTFQVLTKRHARLRSVLTDDDFRELVTQEVVDLVMENPKLNDDNLARAIPDWWPLPNVWVGVSVENQQWAGIRIPALLETPAVVRFLSCEPLLGPVCLDPWHTPHIDGQVRCDGPPPHGLHWVIAGGESGPGARPMHADWARSIRDQCVTAGVAFHFKQWGELAPFNQMSDEGRRRAENQCQSCIGEEDADLIFRVGKKRAGRELDGRTWDEYPAAREATLL